MEVIKIGMTETLFMAVIVLLIGRGIKSKVYFFEKFFIPAPVIGGVLFSIFSLIGHETGLFSLLFDSNLKDMLMIGFFTTIGFSASLSILKKGGIQVMIFLGAATGLIFLQNILGISLAKIFNIHPLLGVAAGSVALTGGHGTAGSIGGILEHAGVQGGMTVAIAAATFGLVAGCLIGGPVGKRLLQKYKLTSKNTENSNETISSHVAESKITEENLFHAIFYVAIAMGIGTLVNPFIKSLGLPAYIMPMLIAAILRNILDSAKKEMPLNEITTVGNISLSLFLAMALMGMKLWELSALAVPLISILLAQTVLMALYAYFVTFYIMGRDYDAATIACGHCGFGMGATPNAMANMEAFTVANGPSIRAFFVVPLVGALFIDFVNVSIITMFINIFK